LSATAALDYGLSGSRAKLDSPHSNAHTLYMGKTKHSKAYIELLDRLASEYRDAPIVEVNDKYRDVFKRAGEQVSVELCHGVWRTFRKGSDCMPGSHESREAAKAHALKMLGLR
jgi:hypothetical protein